MAQCAFEKAIKIGKLIVANENTSHLSLCYFIVLTDEPDCKFLFRMQSLLQGN